HRRDVTTWWCEVMGGPAEYTAELGGYQHMLAKHRGLHITPEQRLRFVTMLSEAAALAGLPDDPEFRAATLGYAEWGPRPPTPPQPAPRFVPMLPEAADLAGLPDDPEFRAAIMGYAEWGTRLAVHNSGDAPDVVEHAPVPRWGGGGAPPDQP